MDTRLHEAITKALLLNTIEGLKAKILDTKARTTNLFGRELDQKGRIERNTEVIALKKKLHHYEHQLKLLS